MIKWGKNETLITLMIVAIAAFVFYYGSRYFLDPLNEALKVTEDTLTEHRLVIKQAELNEQNETMLKQEADTVRKSLPTEEAVDQIVEMFFGLEKSSDVSIESMNHHGVGLTEDAGTYPSDISAIHYQMTLSSDSLAKVESFVEEIEDIERLIEIVELDLTKQSESNVEALITVRAFYNDSILID